MSAPLSHDPLVVNTKDGVCWTRRTVTSSGIALYAPEGVCGCPEFVMATLPELAEHGIVGSADVLPVPVGPVLRSELDQAHDDVVGACLARWESEQENERLRWALASAKRGRARLRAQVAELEHTVQQMVEGLNGHDCPPPNEAPPETVTRWRGYLDTAEARVAELEAERHTTNEALDDAVQELRARPSCPCPPADQPGPHQVGCFFDGVPVSPPSERPVDGPSPLFPTVASLREASSREEPHDSPLHRDWRVGHDLDMPETGGVR